MTDDLLQDRLRYLGIDESNYPVLALLPLVQVAWADGKIQKAEHRLIAQTAVRLGLQTGGSWESVLGDWLRTPPSALQYVRGQQVLLALAQRSGTMSFDMGTLTDLVDLAIEVAEAAGGLFGLMFQVEEEERRALSDLAQILSLGPSIDWSRLRENGDTDW